MLLTALTHVPIEVTARAPAVNLTAISEMPVDPTSDVASSALRINVAAVRAREDELVVEFAVVSMALLRAVISVTVVCVLSIRLEIAVLADSRFKEGG